MGTVLQTLWDELQNLSEPQQEEVLNLIQTIRTRPEGENGLDFLAAVQIVGISPEDLALMKQAIEETCEEIEEFEPLFN